MFPSRSTVRFLIDWLFTGQQIRLICIASLLPLHGTSLHPNPEFHIKLYVGIGFRCWKIMGHHLNSWPVHCDAELSELAPLRAAIYYCRFIATITDYLLSIKTKDDSSPLEGDAWNYNERTLYYGHWFTAAIRLRPQESMPFKSDKATALIVSLIVQWGGKRHTTWHCPLASITSIDSSLQIWIHIFFFLVKLNLPLHIAPFCMLWQISTDSK